MFSPALLQRHSQANDSFSVRRQQQLLEELDGVSTCTTVKMSNLDPNRYTNEEAERRLQVLLDAFGTENRGHALVLASGLFGAATEGARFRDEAVESLVNRLQLDAELSQHIRYAAGSLWSFFREHHSAHFNEIYRVLWATPPEQAAIPAVPLEIQEGASPVSLLASASGASGSVLVAAAQRPDVVNSVGEVAAAHEPGVNFGVASVVGAAEEQGVNHDDISTGWTGRAQSIGSHLAPSLASGVANCVESDCRLTQELDDISRQQEQHNIPAVEDEEEEQKPRAFKRSNDEDEDKNNPKKKKPHSED